VIWILISIGWLFLLGLVLHDAEHDEGQAKKGAEQNHCEAPLALVAPEKEYARQDEHRAAERNHWTHERRHNRNVAALSAIAGGAAVLAALFAGGAYVEARRQANAAEQSVVAVQRAFIVVSGLKEEIVREKDKVVGVNFTPIIRNSGNTPAKQIRWVTLDPFNVTQTSQIREFFRDPNPTDPDDFIQRPDNPPAVSISRGILGPHDDLLMGPALPLNERTFQYVLTNRIGRFYFGAIRYFDLFSNKERVTKYCYAVNSFVSGQDGFDLNGPVTVPNVRPFPTLCAHWNCADEDCEADKQRYEEEKRQAPQRNNKPGQN
jgi:hypothetical protein